MHAAGLRSGGGSNYNSGKSCDCTNWMGSAFKYMGHRGDAKAMARAMKDNGADVCMIEHGVIRCHSKAIRVHTHSPLRHRRDVDARRQGLAAARTVFWQ